MGPRSWCVNALYNLVVTTNLENMMDELSTVYRILHINHAHRFILICLELVMFKGLVHLQTILFNLLGVDWGYLKSFD